MANEGLQEFAELLKPVELKEEEKIAPKSPGQNVPSNRFRSPFDFFGSKKKKPDDETNSEVEKTDDVKEEKKEKDKEEKKEENGEKTSIVESQQEGRSSSPPPKTKKEELAYTGFSSEVVKLRIIQIRRTLIFSISKDFKFVLEMGKN